MPPLPTPVKESSRAVALDVSAGTPMLAYVTSFETRLHGNSMKKSNETAQAGPEAEAAPRGSEESAGMVQGGYLAAWLTDPRTEKYFGESFALKADVLVCFLQRGNLAEVARQHGVTRAAASKQARRAKALFGGLATTG